MCVAENSVDLYTSTCPMCKFFRNTARCPHKRETCRNRVNHPRHDVRYISNAEVATFKGCGYCKWATQTNPPPPPNKSGMHNQGWPGCCRPPQPSELDRILPADWPAVHVVHKTPIPLEVKQLLESLKLSSGSPTLSPASPTNGSYLKDVSNKTAERDRERKTGIQRLSTGGSPNGTLRTYAQKNRPAVSMAGGGGSSPKTRQSRLGGSGTPPAGTIASPPDTPNANSNSVRRAGHVEAHIPLKRIEGFRTTPPGSTRKLCSDGQADHQHQGLPTELTRERSATITRSSINNGNGNSNKDGVRTPSARTSPTLESPTPAQQPQLKRRDSSVRPSLLTAKSTTTLSKATAKASAEAAAKGNDRDREPERDRDREGRDRERERERDGAAILEKALKSLKVTTAVTTTVASPPSAVSSGGSDTSSDGGSRSSEGTVTSDGGFTDYLSDESEAELQRQAEVRAAILEQNRQEEAEFRIARKQLAGVDLRPPPLWTTGVTHKAINTGYVRGN